jgi:hypothetical protein
MEKTVWKILFVILLFSFLHGENLLDTYKKRMHGAKESTTLTKKTFALKSISNEIKIIQNMKKTTFESTSDFENRRDQAIAKLDGKMDFYNKNALEEYSAGTVQLKHYNPDTEILTVIFNWNKPLTTLLLETDLLKMTSFNIEREKAKELFSNNKKQFFHIKFMYLYNKITVSKILLYNKYLLYKSVYVKQTGKFKNTSTTKVYTGQKIQARSKKIDILSPKSNIKNNFNNQKDMRGEEHKDKELTMFNKYFWIILILIIIAILFLLKYMSSINKINSNTNSVKNIKTSSVVVNEKPKTIKSKRNIPIDKNCSTKLHEFVTKHNINLQYVKTKQPGEYFTIEIFEKKELLAIETAKSLKEAKKKAQCVVLNKFIKQRG